MTVLAGSLAGCVVNEKTFNEGRARARQHPELVASGTAHCVRYFKYQHIEVKRWIAGYMHTDLNGFPEKVCNRMIKGYLSGRMTYADLDALSSQRRFTPTMTSILRH